MYRDLENCKSLLHKGGYTCVVKQGESLYTATARGIRPLMTWLESDTLRGAVLADKVIGKAAAFLLEKGGVRAVYADVISAPAAEVLERAEISYHCTKKVPCIQNRTGNGVCPMESAVLEIHNADEAFLKLRETLKQMRHSKG